MHDPNSVVESCYTNRECNITIGKRRRRTAPTWTKVRIILTVLLVVCTILVSGALIFREMTRPSPAEEKACMTMTCIKAAARIHSWIDNSIKPCDNFFKFACGGWMKKEMIPEEKSSVGSVKSLRYDLLVRVKRILESSVETNDPKANRMVAKMRKFYQTCLARDSYGSPSTLLQQMFSLFPLPYINSTGWNDYGKPEFERFLANLANYGNLFVVNTGVSVDMRNSSRYIFVVDQPGTYLPRQHFLDDSFKENQEALRVLMNKILTKAYEDLNVTATVDAGELLQLLTDIANATMPSELRRDPRHTDNRWTVRELKDSMTNFNWEKYLNQRMNISSKRLTDNDTVVVTAPDYLKGLDSILAERNRDTFGQFITFALIIHILDVLPKDYREIFADYKEKIGGSRGDDTRWKECARKVKDNHFRDVMARLYSEEYFDKTSKAEVLDIISYVRNAFYQRLEVNSWMDPDVRKIASEKARKMKSKIGYPDHIYNGTYLVEHYEEVPVTKNVVSDIFQYSLIQNRILLDQLGTRVSRKWRKRTSVIVNAFYNPSFNQIYFPMGILTSPLFDKDNPKYLNYGGIGVIVGHEITHGFDDSGRQRDQYGNLRSWWPESTIKAFKKAAQCIIDQYSSYRAPITIRNITLNGRKTQGENIADNGGIKQAFKGYREMIKKRGKEELKLPGLPYTPHQLFFINYAQIRCTKMRQKAWVAKIFSSVHSPKMFRVIGALSNMPAFHETFNCQTGTKMHPKKQCSVW